MYMYVASPEMGWASLPSVHAHVHTCRVMISQTAVVGNGPHLHIFVATKDSGDSSRERR